MENKSRSEKYQKNNLLESHLTMLNELLRIGSDAFFEKYELKTNPKVYFIVGAPRSGTTLLFQLLSGSNYYAFPSNLISRFYENPHIGFLTQKLITDPELNYKNEMNFIPENLEYNSDIGKTKGLFSPNEFWYFWKRFFPIMQELPFDFSKIDSAKINRLKKELGFIQEITEKPFLFKGLCFNWNLKDVLTIFPNAGFIHIQRNELENSYSILKTRKTFFNDETKWYSFKGPEYIELKQKGAIEQCAGQVIQTNKFINQQLVYMPKHIKVSYENLCDSPIHELEKIFHFTESLLEKIRLNSSLVKNEKAEIPNNVSAEINIAIVKMKN